MEADFRRVAHGLLKTLEAERSRVAGVLGGEIVSVLTMARYLIEEAAKRRAQGEPTETSEMLRSAGIWIRNAAHELRTLCSEARPNALDDLGLLSALSSHLRDFGQQNRGILVWPRITVAEADIPDSLKLAIFRIAEAAMSNVARHSKASTVRMFLSMSGDELRLGIEDNGVGFDPERFQYRRRANDCCGLGIIQLWAEISAGHCTVDASPRHGARVLVSWQIQAAPFTTQAPHSSEVGIPPAP